MEILQSLESHLRPDGADEFIAWWHDESQPLQRRREDIDYRRHRELVKEYGRFFINRTDSGSSVWREFDIEAQQPKKYRVAIGNEDGVQKFDEYYFLQGTGRI